MNDFVVSLMLLGALSPQAGDLPLWATANRFGIVPESSGGLALLQAGSSFDENKTLQWHWGASLGLRADRNSTTFIPDELYAGLRWKALRLDLGIWHPSQAFKGADSMLGTLSTTGGNIMMSGNARSMPGCSLSLEHWDVPFTGGHLQLSGSFGDYATTDRRYVPGALVHNTSASLRARIGEHFFITAGFDHYTVWGGVSPEFGPQKVNLQNYFRILTGRAGGEDASLGDQVNSLGDHRGRELIRLDWKTGEWTLTFQHDIPYDDRSGMKFKNFPDGVNTVAFSFKDKSRWISDIVYEYHNTMNQSGDCERRLATAEEIAAGDPRVYGIYTIVGGADNYCNNYEYRSGWSNYGRMIGTPLFFMRSDGLGTWNNLLTAHHLGLSGSLFHKFPYKLMLSWSRNYGCWFTPAYDYDAGTRYEVPLERFSSAFECSFPILGAALQLVPGLYADTGAGLFRSFAAILSVKYNFIRL